MDLELEKKWEKEFENEWNKQHGPNTHPEGCMCTACDYIDNLKPDAKEWYLLAHRKQEEAEMDKAEARVKELENLKIGYQEELEWTNKKLDNAEAENVRLLIAIESLLRIVNRVTAPHRRREEG